MSRAHPQPGCYDLAFQASYPMDEPAEVALEDYSRVLTRAQDSEALRQDEDPSMVEGVHVCGLGTTLTQVIMTDIEDFARQLVLHRNGGGLGWS
jgi:hypothetical protein